ncbi:MAG: thioredoxin [Lachnospiraceae bacterium]|nr:thioredoxin [Lachnospiraceae bacterium]
MATTKITWDNFEKEVIQSEQTVLIDFWATWCGPCQMLAPFLEEVAEEMPEVKFCKVNVDEEPELTSRFGVMNIPMLVVMKGGKLVNQSVGFQGKEQIKDLVTKF